MALNITQYNNERRASDEVAALPIMGRGDSESRVRAGVWAASAQPEMSAPYLYYYSAARRAFVVERADGSDSQNLIAYTCDDCVIYGPGWSPSGRWLA